MTAALIVLGVFAASVVAAVIFGRIVREPERPQQYEDGSTTQWRGNSVRVIRPKQNARD